MGVLKAPPRDKVRIEDFAPNVDYRDFVFSDQSDYDSDSSDDSVDAPTRNAVSAAVYEETYRRRSRKARNCKKVKFCPPSDPFGTDGVRLKSNSGRHKRRRVEHAQNILSMCDPEDIVKDFSDIVPQVETAFSKLFLDMESMAKWHSLAEKDAEEQERLIKEMDKCGPSTASDDEFEHVLGGSPMKLPRNYDRMTTVQKRDYHPAHSAGARFSKLAHNFKAMLSKRRGVPFELLDDVERKLREFFVATPNGIWVDVVENAHTRKYYHTVASFLDLLSTSIPGDNGQKFLEIRNKRGIFIAPYQYLVAYLHHRNGAKSLSTSE